jgi:hypothetical protein
VSDPPATEQEGIGGSAVERRGDPAQAFGDVGGDQVQCGVVDQGEDRHRVHEGHPRTALLALGHDDIAGKEQADSWLCLERSVGQRWVSGAEDLAAGEVDIELLPHRRAHINLGEDAEALRLERVDRTSTMRDRTGRSSSSGASVILVSGSGWACTGRPTAAAPLPRHEARSVIHHAVESLDLDCLEQYLLGAIENVPVHDWHAILALDQEMGVADLQEFCK